MTGLMIELIVAYDEKHPNAGNDIPHLSGCQDNSKLVVSG
jgi:hypothetical protein